ncbi:translocation protein-like protein sec66 [Microthyrium microscopicum]|uniref:Translocation protein-like protein sec66 n=1 Tax=Microthyrium microscopicum TaxID=703497 RepID=A0A6A6UUV0_9PEZI|nr:translocation protein-like protein sec66 [Microthyrium microscopicum]
MVNWIGLAFPFLYLGLLVGALSTFSSLYRKRKASRAQSLAPWFESHHPRDVYLSLIHLDEDDSEKPEVPDTVLKAALLRRAQEDVQRVLQMRNSKQALATLLQRGSIGDDLWQRFLRAEQECEEEVRDVVQEANAFADNWGSFIFQSAHEMAQNQQTRKRMAEIQAETEAEKEWWEKKRSTVQAEFMKELDDEAAAGTTTRKLSSKGSDDEAVLVEAPAGASQQGGGKKKKKGKN